MSIGPFFVYVAPEHTSNSTTVTNRRRTMPRHGAKRNPPTSNVAGIVPAKQTVAARSAPQPKSVAALHPKPVAESPAMKASRAAAIAKASLAGVPDQSN